MHYIFFQIRLFAFQLWDLRQDESVRTFKGHTEDVNDVKFLANDLNFLTASDDGTCRLYDLRVEEKHITKYVIGPSYEDRFASQRTLSSGSHIESSNAKQHVRFSKVACSLSGRLVFGGCNDNIIYVWDALKAKKPGMLHGHAGNISGLEVSPNGCALASSSWDGRIKIWN